MDDDERLMMQVGCGTCLGILIAFLACCAAFTYACILVIDAIKS